MTRKSFRHLSVLSSLLFIFLELSGLSNLQAAQKPSFYTIDAVRVDAQGSTAIEAKEKAHLEGQRSALKKLLEDLTPNKSKHTSLHALVDGMENNAISALVIDFEILKEKTPGTQYIATLTYRFHSEGIRKLLGDDDISPASLKTSSFVLIPVLQIGEKKYLWEDYNVWRDIWKDKAKDAESIKLIIPMGDLDDLHTLDADALMAGQKTQEKTFLDRYEAPEGLLIVMAKLDSTTSVGTKAHKLPEHAKAVDVSIYKGSLTRAPEFLFTIEANKDLTGNPEKLKHLLDRAAFEALRQINAGFTSSHHKAHAPEKYLARLSTKEEWFQIRKALDKLKSDYFIEDYKVLNLSFPEVSLSVKPYGTFDMLQNYCRAVGLVLVKRENDWIFEYDASLIQESSPKN